MTTMVTKYNHAFPLEMREAVEDNDKRKHIVQLPLSSH